MENHELDNPTWSPPRCPSPTCKFHNDLSTYWPWKHMGTYLRKLKPKRIRRFQCLHCGVTLGYERLDGSTSYTDPTGTFELNLPANIGEVTGDGDVLVNPDGSKVSHDYSGLVIRAGVRVAFSSSSKPYLLDQFFLTTRR